jgi:ATP-dependent DNA ligase
VYSGPVVADGACNPLETDQSRFELGDVPRKTRDILWARPELVAEIEFAEFTASGRPPSRA